MSVQNPHKESQNFSSESAYESGLNVNKEMLESASAIHNTGSNLLGKYWLQSCESTPT